MSADNEKDRPDRDYSGRSNSNSRSDYSGREKEVNHDMPDKLDFDKKGKRQPYDFIIYPKQEYVDFLEKDNAKQFKDLAGKVGVSTFEKKELDLGLLKIAVVLRIFDSDEEKKWECINLVIDDYLKFFDDGKVPDKQGELVIVIPNRKTFDSALIMVPKV